MKHMKNTSKTALSKLFMGVTLLVLVMGPLGITASPLPHQIALNQQEQLTLNYAANRMVIDGTSNDWKTSDIHDIAFEFSWGTVPGSFGALLDYNQTYFYVTFQDSTDVQKANVTPNGIDATFIWLDMDGSYSLNNGDQRIIIYRNGTAYNDIFTTQWTRSALINPNISVINTDTNAWSAEFLIPHILPSDLNIAVDYQDAQQPDSYEIDAAFDSQIAISVTETLDFNLSAHVTLTTITGEMEFIRNIPVLQTYVGYTLNISMYVTSTVNAPVTGTILFLLPQNTAYVIPSSLQNKITATTQANGTILITWNVGLVYPTDLQQASIAVSFTETGSYTFSQAIVTWATPQGTNNQQKQGTIETIEVQVSPSTTTTTTTTETQNTEISNLFTLPEKTSSTTQNTSIFSTDFAQYLGIIAGISIPLALIVGIAIKMKKP